MGSDEAVVIQEEAQVLTCVLESPGYPGKSHFPLWASVARPGKPGAQQPYTDCSRPAVPTGTTDVPWLLCTPLTSHSGPEPAQRPPFLNTCPRRLMGLVTSVLLLSQVSKDSHYHHSPHQGWAPTAWLVCYLPSHQPDQWFLTRGSQILWGSYIRHLHYDS